MVQSNAIYATIGLVLIGSMNQKGHMLSSRLKWFILLRTVIISFILAFTVIMQLKGMKYLLTPQITGLYIIAGLTYLITLVYAALYTQIGSSSIFGYTQLIIDNLLISLTIIITGGVESSFSVLYFLTVIGASIVFYRRGGLIITLQGSIFYFTAIFVPFLYRYSPWLDIEGRYLYLTVPYVFYRGIVNISAFLVVCLLSSFVSESLRRAGEALIARESDLAELQSLYENIVQSIASGLITTDLEGKIISFNRAAEKITQRRAEECSGDDFCTIFRLTDGSDPFKHSWESMEFSMRCEGSLVDSSSIILGMTFSPLKDENDDIRGVICSFQDLTEIRKLEEQIKRSDRLAAIGEMAAGVAHEIRNPLASISGSIQVLKEDLPVDENTHDLMDIVTRETARLNNIINDFLLFANPRSLQTQEADIGKILNESLTLLKKSLPDNAVYNFVVSDDSGGKKVVIDPQMIKQVFWNLALNSVQAMPGGGTLEVKITHSIDSVAGMSRNAEFIIIEFIDTGIGFSPDEMEKVFTPFFSTKDNGTGLGLSIVFKILEKHRGSIEIESKKGKGSKFKLKLPVVAETDGPQGG